MNLVASTATDPQDLLSEEADLLLNQEPVQLPHSAEEQRRLP
jgi:hypothetical protein